MSTPPGTLTTALTMAWGKLRDVNPELPLVRVALSAATPPADHGPARWAWDEAIVTGLVISAGTLREGSEATLQALLHEAAHVLCWVRNVQDTTTRGVYHNKRFLQAAVEVGLTWPDGTSAVPRRGFPTPELTDQTRNLFEAELGALEPAIKETLPYLSVTETPRSSRPDRLTAECNCNPPRKLRISATVLALGPVVCGICSSPFEVP